MPQEDMGFVSAYIIESSRALFMSTVHRGPGLSAVLRMGHQSLPQAASSHQKNTTSPRILEVRQTRGQKIDWGMQEETPNPETQMINSKP